MFSVNLPHKSTCSIRENSSENGEVFFIYYLFVIFSENVHREIIIDYIQSGQTANYTSCEKY